MVAPARAGRAVIPPGGPVAYDHGVGRRDVQV